MKKIITLLAFFMFASAELTFASVAATATTSLPSMTASTSSVTPSSKKETVKEWFKDKTKDLEQRQIIAAVLCFFFGTFGVHNFYLGRRKPAIWQLVLTLVGILTSVIVIGLVILLAVWIWSIIDLIKILTGKMG